MTIYRNPFYGLIFVVLALVPFAAWFAGLAIPQDVTLSTGILSTLYGIWLLFTPYVIINKSDIRINNNLLYHIIIEHEKIVKASFAQADKIILYKGKAMFVIKLNRVKPAQREKLINQVKELYKA